MALGGFLALFVSFVLTAVVALEDAIGGDGVSGPAVTAGFWAVGLGAVAGALAAVLPGSVLGYGARRGAVVLQYALAVIAPVIALMD